MRLHLKSKHFLIFFVILASMMLAIYTIDRYSHNIILNLVSGNSINDFTNELVQPEINIHPEFNNAREYLYRTDNYVVSPELDSNEAVFGFVYLARNNYFPTFKRNNHFTVVLNQTNFLKWQKKAEMPQKCYLIQGRDGQPVLYFEQNDFGSENVYLVGIQTFKYFENGLPNFRITVGEPSFGLTDCSKINSNIRELKPNTYIEWNKNLYDKVYGNKTVELLGQ